ncbi:LytR/AlgR family response regulator transcription factor [Aquimarina spongiae]|nr:LytTR family DNA-binding domain-containing protein [Aquimarina spongiae]
MKPANKFLPHIVVVGLGIGTANYVLNDNLNWIQWCIQSLCTSFIIGYTLVVIGVNKSWLMSRFGSKTKLYLFLFSTFLFTGTVATEFEHVIRSVVFQSQEFQLFSSGKMYVFNGIISLILGYSFFLNDFYKSKTTDYSQEQTATTLSANEWITTIPVKQGEHVLLIPIEDIVYFEAYDNYAFVYMQNGEKKLCDYSLRFLEQRLTSNFSRVHRKYIVNESHIKKVTPYVNGRYVLLFENELSSITSSKSYASTIRKLIKIE